MGVADVRFEGQRPGGCSRTRAYSPLPGQKIAKIGSNVMISWM
jgi:hypothetical protein